MGLHDRLAAMVLAAMVLAAMVLAAMVLAGFYLSWCRGDNMFTVLTIPSFGLAYKWLRGSAQEMRALVSWLTLALVAMHAAAALVFRDAIMHRMLPEWSWHHA